MEKIRHICIGNGHSVGNFSVSIFPQKYRHCEGGPLRWAHVYAYSWKAVMELIDLFNPEHVSVSITSWSKEKVVGIDHGRD